MVKPRTLSAPVVVPLTQEEDEEIRLTLNVGVVTEQEAISRYWAGQP